MIYPWHHSRRFNSYPEYFKKLFGGRLQKVTVDAGFTCPNRDGTLSTGGCTFCSNDAFNPSYCQPSKSVTQQIKEGIEFQKVRYSRAIGYLVYFQAFSNTYAPIEILKKLYTEALYYPEVKGIVIGTRPDCVDEEKLDMLSEISKIHFVVVEYGIESCYNNTLKAVNRGHTFEDTQHALYLTHKKNLLTGGHLIFGLPGESREEMLKEAEIISELPLHSIKFHQLQIMKNTRMANDFAKNPENFTFFELEDYLSFLVDFVEKLNPNLVIERIAGEIPPRFNAGPNWGNIRYDEVLRRFEKRLEERDTWQGKFYIKEV